MATHKVKMLLQDKVPLQKLSWPGCAGDVTRSRVAAGTRHYH
jgi:hypothetical protein